MTARSISAVGVTAFVSLAAALAGCAGSKLASEAAEAPELELGGQTKCGVSKSQMEPLVVEWPSAARGKLESTTRRGLVPVRYEGCEMEVLSGCRATGKYRYAPLTPKHDTVRIRNEDELYASIPVHAAELEAKLRSAGELNVDMTIVGRYEADQDSVGREQLQGDCASATHLVTALTVGAFDFFAGAKAEASGGVGVAGLGAGTSGKSERETLSRDGSARSCRAAKAGDKTPPFECGALLRIEVTPLREGGANVAPPAIAPGAAPPAGPPGMPGLHPSMSAAVSGLCYSGSIGPCSAACDKGTMSACFTLGSTYISGIGVKKDIAKGIGYVKKACAGGDAAGCSFLAAMHEAGQGVSQDLDKAMELYARACEWRHADACLTLGLRHEQGQTTPRDHRKALQAYRRGCELHGRSDHRSAGSCAHADRLEDSR